MFVPRANEARMLSVLYDSAGIISLTLSLLAMSLLYRDRRKLPGLYFQLQIGLLGGALVGDAIVAISQPIILLPHSAFMIISRLSTVDFPILFSKVAASIYFACELFSLSMLVISYHHRIISLRDVNHTKPVTRDGSLKWFIIAFSLLLTVLFAFAEGLPLVNYSVFRSQGLNECGSGLYLIVCQSLFSIFDQSHVVDPNLEANRSLIPAEILALMMSSPTVHFWYLSSAAFQQIGLVLTITTLLIATEFVVVFVRLMWLVHRLHKEIKSRHARQAQIDFVRTLLLQTVFFSSFIGLPLLLVLLTVDGRTFVPIVVPSISLSTVSWHTSMMSLVVIFCSKSLRKILRNDVYRLLRWDLPTSKFIDPGHGHQRHVWLESNWRKLHLTQQMANRVQPRGQQSAKHLPTSSATEVERKPN